MQPSKVISKALAFLLIAVPFYLLLSFAAWDLNISHWHWVLRLLFTFLFAAPFGKDQYAKIANVI